MSLKFAAKKETELNCYVAGSCRHLSLVKLYSTTDKMHKNKGISMYKTKGSGAEAPIHKEPPGAGPYS